MIFVAKITSNKEESILESISDRVRKKGLNVYSLISPHGLKGYLFVEAESRDAAEKAIYNIRFVKGLLSRAVEYKDIENILKPSMTNVSINKGDIVEMIGSTLKGEKAKVLRVDKQKEEVTVSLLGSLVQMQLKLKIDDVKVIRREKENED